ncbi:hypothetical protein HOP54_02325 [Halomonas daqingensis]|uniref:hypothetical protein n=1 Tax=Billgrantia desiderata TaxID=52021 RepID=UPI001F4185CF|nr:hypothetical protein [Halomonas desiderata]MCE8027525.1 hypothetical protein [Halomonas desiderata]
MSETPSSTAADLLQEGERLVAAIRSLEGQPEAGPELLRLYLQLEDIVSRCKALLGGQTS